MSTSNATQNLPNPDTPLAFLPPQAAYETSVAVYVLAASLGVLIWDVLDNISADFRLIFKLRITLNTVAYFGSRVGSLGYTIGSAIFQTAPIGNCPAGETFPDIFYPISLSCSALLFFFRVRAVYSGNRLVVGFFFLLWLGVVACTMLIPITVRGAHIGETAYCEDADVPSFAFAALFAPLIHDTLVFTAISWRLVANSHMEFSLRDGIKVAIFGQYLPAFTKTVLLDGQKYYLITMICNVVTVILAFDTSVPTPMRSMSSTPNIVLTNIMACRIYRHTVSQLTGASANLTTFNANGQSKHSFTFGQKRRGATDQIHSIPLSNIKTLDRTDSSVSNGDSPGINVKVERITDSERWEE